MYRSLVFRVSQTYSSTPRTFVACQKLLAYSPYHLQTASRSFHCTARRADDSMATTALTDRKYIRYDSGVTKVSEGEEEAIQRIKDIFFQVMSGDASKYGRAYPLTHAKTLGIVKGKLIIPDDLPQHLKQGPFAKGGEYPIVLRYSFNSHDYGADATKSLSRGVSFKIFGFPGDRFPEGAGNLTQDFAMNSQIPVSELPDAHTAAEVIGILRKAQSDPMGAFQDIMKRPDAALQIASNRQTRRPVESMDFYAQLSFRFGDYVAKHGIFPATDVQKKLAEHIFQGTEGGADDLAKSIRDFYAQNDAVYDWKFQLLENLDDQPVEYGGKVWDASKYPFQSVAKFVFPKQETSNEELKAFWVDSMRVNAWRGTTMLEPLGSSNRVRRAMYAWSGKLRLDMNKSKFIDVQKIEELPGPIPEDTKVYARL